MIKWIPRFDLRDNSVQLSFNPNAVDYLAEHPGLLSRRIFKNPNPDAVPLMLIRLDEIKLIYDDPLAYHDTFNPVGAAAHDMCENQNPGIMALLEDPKYEYLRRWEALSCNPLAMRLLEKHLHLVDREWLCLNPKAQHLVEDIERCCGLTEEQLMSLARNQSPWAMRLIENYIDELNLTPRSKRNTWYTLSANPFAVPLMEKYPECVDIRTACSNPKAMHIVRERLNDPDISWISLSCNGGAIDILRANPEKIVWDLVGFNPNLMQLWDDFKDEILRQRPWQHPEMFVPEVDYQVIRDRPFSEVLKELTALYYHPSRMDPETFDLDGTTSVFSSKRKRSV
jgi:hypothetical protein